MEQQNFKNHARIVPLFHLVLGLISMAIFVLSVIYFFQHFIDLIAVLILLMGIAIPLSFWFIRSFPLKAQDRAIRAEENLRHFVLTGKLLDSRLTMSQIVGLRFASDGEFPALAQKAAETGMGNKEIKQAVVNWRPDNDRV